MAWLTLVAILLIVFLSTGIRATLGFGNALVAMPLLTLVIGIQQATPLVGLLSLTIGVVMLLESWQAVDLASAWRLVLASLGGMPFGVYLLVVAPAAVVETMLGLLLIGFSLYNLQRWSLPTLRRGWAAYLFGFGAGILGSAYNTNGPPIIIYGTLVRWSPDEFRATLQSYFLLAGLAIVIGHGLGGLWTPAVLWLFLATLPVLALALVVGRWLRRRISPPRFARLVYVALIGMGLLLLL